MSWSWFRLLTCIFCVHRLTEYLRQGRISWSLCSKKGQSWVQTTLYKPVSFWALKASRAMPSSQYPPPAPQEATLGSHPRSPCQVILAWGAWLSGAVQLNAQAALEHRHAQTSLLLGHAFPMSDIIVPAQYPGEGHLREGLQRPMESLCWPRELCLRLECLWGVLTHHYHYSSTAHVKPVCEKKRFKGARNKDKFH